MKHTTPCLGVLVACGLALVVPAAAEEPRPEPPKAEIHLRIQGWYQRVADAAPNSDGALQDFQLRRAYLSVAGSLTPRWSVFAHVAADRLGQQGLDVPSVGLGSGLALRDGWVVFDVAGPLKVQAGRMYVPFTRAFGTESTFTLLAVDIPWTQGGVRGGTFYPGKVGRDDGVVVWGNVAGGRLQYRAGVMDGVEDAGNPEDRLRVAGRVAVNLLQPETSWFNQGTYLGARRVLALGAGFDRQPDLTLGGRTGEDYSAWTVDAFFDHPMARGGWTAEAAFIRTVNTPGPVAFTALAPGDDHRIAYLQLGYLFPPWPHQGRLQVYGRHERLDVDEKPDTAFTSVGLNYLLGGHQRKLTLDWTRAEQGEQLAAVSAGRDRNVITVQLAVGF